MKNDIKKNYSQDSLFDELGLSRLKESYMRDDEKSPQDRFAYVSNIFGSNRIPKDYMITLQSIGFPLRLPYFPTEDQKMVYQYPVFFLT